MSSLLYDILLYIIYKHANICVCVQIFYYTYINLSARSQMSTSIFAALTAWMLSESVKVRAALVRINLSWLAAFNWALALMFPWMQNNNLL